MRNALHKQLDAISSREALADYIALLQEDLENNGSAWENNTLDQFLSAMEDWIRSMENFYKNTNQAPPDIPTWRLFAEMLYAATMYE